MTTTRTYTHREIVFDLVDKERQRQDDKFGWAAPSILPGEDDWRKLAVLAEEFGEVSRALLERDFGNDTTEHLEQELVEVAAVAIAWLEFARARRAGWTP